MKKHFKYRVLQLMATAAVMAAASACTDQPDTDTMLPMEFSANFGELSRASTQVPLDGNKYSMWASAVYKSEEASSSFYAPNFYFNTNPLRLDYVEASESYVASNYYYPLRGNMQFVAYATNLATVPNATFAYDSNKKPTKLTVDLSDSDGLREVVYSDITSVNCPITDNPTIRFHRSQTNLRFKFIPADQYTCQHVIINSIELTGLCWKGKFVVTYDSQGKASHTWTTAYAAANYTLTNVAKNTVPAENSAQRMRWESGKAVPLEIGDGLHMRPKTNGRTQIIIRYTVINDPTSVSQGGVGGAVPDELLGRTDDYMRYLTYVIDAEPSKNWEEGTQYYYNITVHGSTRMDVEQVSVAEVTNGATGTMQI